MQLEVQFLWVTLSLLQVQIWISASTQYKWWCINKITAVTREREGWETVSHWSIGNLLDGNCVNFLPWQWRKSFGQILVLQSGQDFLILCLFILLWKDPLSIIFHSHLWIRQQQIFCLSASHSKVPTWSVLVGIGYAAVKRSHNGLQTVTHRRIFFCSSPVQGSCSRLGCDFFVAIWAENGKLCHYFATFFFPTRHIIN